jgi:ParB family chromosome partitioning protein
MAPAVAEAQAAATVSPGPFRMLDRELIVPSPLNPRKHFDVEGLHELAESFGDVGIIEPLVVRPIADGPAGPRFELVAGERRWRAAGIAQLEEVPVIVRELSDTQALEIMVIENNQRQDVNALEEADGFSRLLKSGYDIDRLAERLGRSKKYVYDRVKLLDLVPTAQQLLLEQKMTPGHAILLARLKPEQQEKAIDPYDGGAFTQDSAADDDDVVADEDADDAGPKSYRSMKPRSVRELQSWIARHIRFDVAHAAEAAPLEFGDVAAQVSNATARPGRGRKVISITFDHMVHPDARDEGERTYGASSWRYADGEEHPADSWSSRTKVFPRCEHSVLGVVVAGSQHYGRAFEVCVARDRCRVHWKEEVEQREKNQKLRESGEVAKADKNDARGQQREAQERRKRELEEKRRDRVEERAINRIVEGVKDVTPELLRAAIANLVGADIDGEGFQKRFGVRVRGYGAKPSEFKSLSGRSLAQALTYCVVSSALNLGEGSDVCRWFGVDLKKVETEVVAEEKATAVPAPKPTQKKATPAKKPSAVKSSKKSKGKKR